MCGFRESLSLVGSIAALVLAGCPSTENRPEPDADVVEDVAEDVVDDTSSVDSSAPDTGLTDDTVAGDAGDAVDDTSEPDTVAAPVIGRVNAIIWEADAHYDLADLYVHGVFSESLGALDVIDPAGWLAAWHELPAAIADDFWALPAELDTAVTVDESGGGPFVDDTLDAGAFVALGDAAAVLRADLVEAGGPYVYASFLEEGFLLAQGAIDGPLDLRVDGGGDIPAIALEDVASLPVPFGFSSHDPFEPLPIRYGQPLDFTWDPPDDVRPGDSLVLMVESEDSLRVARVEDDGELSLDALFGDLSTEGELLSLAFERLRDETVDAATGAVRVTTARKQWFYPQVVGSWDITPSQVGVGRSASVRVRLFDFVVSDAVTVSLGDGVTVSQVAVADAVGHVVSFVAEVDPTASSGPRTLVVSDGDTTLLEVAEAFWVTRPLESAGDCTSTLDEGAIPDGTWTFSDAGAEVSEFSPSDCPLEPPGREQVIPVSLQAGERLRARLWATDAYPVLYFADTCGGTPWGCEVSAGPERPAEVELVADTDMEVLLVADSHMSIDGPAREMRLDLRRTAPASVVVVPTRVDASSEPAVDVFATGGFTVPSSPDAYAFSDGVTVEAVEVVESDWAVLDLAVPSVDTPRAVDLTVTAGGQPFTTSGVFTVIPTLVPAIDCGGAIQTDPVPPGEYHVILVGSDIVDETPCPDYLALGAVVPVRLGPGETLHATVSGPGEDTRVQLLLTCEAPTVAARCSDLGTTEWPEYVTWTGPAEASTVYVAVEAFADGLSTIVDLSLEVSR